MSFQIKTYQNLDDQLLSSWLNLWNTSSCSHFFNHPSWFKTCRQVYPSDTYRIITVFDNQGLAAVLPVCQERKFGIKTLTCPGGEHMNKLPLLTKDNAPKIIAYLIDFLTDLGRFYLPEASETLNKIIKKDHRTIKQSEVSISPYMPLTRDPFYYFSKKRRSRVFSRIKQFSSQLAFKSCKNDLAALETAFALDEKSSKRKKGMVTFTGEQDKEFYRSLVRNFQEMVSIDILYLNKEPMVFSINLIYSGTYHLFKTAFDERFNHLIPGKLLLYYVFPHLREERFVKFDFSRGTSVFKREFTPFFYKQYDLFYAKNVFIRWWWSLAINYGRGKRRLFENERFFKVYLWLKKSYTKMKNFK